MIPQSKGMTASFNPQEQKSTNPVPPVSWIDFNSVNDDVEKCEYEYHPQSSQDEHPPKKMWCQLSNVFSGTLLSFNITDKIETCNYPQFLKLPNP